MVTPQSKLTHSTAWEAREWQEFTSSQQKFYQEHPDLGPPGSVARLGAEFKLTEPVANRVNGLLELVKEFKDQSGLTLTNHDDHLTTVHINSDAPQSRSLSSGLKVAQIALGGRSITYFDGQKLQMTLKDPVNFARAFLVEQMIPVSTTAVDSIAIQGPGVLLLDPAKLGTSVLENVGWDQFQSYLTHNQAAVAYEQTVGKEASSLIVWANPKDKTEFRSADHQRAIADKLISHFDDDLKPEHLTVLFLEWGSYIEHFYSSALLVEQVLAEAHFNPAISEINWSTAVDYDPTVSRKDNVKLQDELTEQTGAVDVIVRGAEAYHQVIKDLNGIDASSNWFGSLVVTLEPRFPFAANREARTVIY